MKNLFIALALAVSGAAYAQEGDLVLPGAKWNAKFTGFICAAFTPVVERPAAFAEYNVVFENIVSDSTLDNGLIKATFEDHGTACRYNLMVLADNAASTMRFVMSKAYATAGDSEHCEHGKAMLDGFFEANNYLYYGHPHNLAVMGQAAGAREVCNADSIGVNFVVTGRIRQ